MCGGGWGGGGTWEEEGREEEEGNEEGDDDRRWDATHLPSPQIRTQGGHENQASTAKAFEAICSFDGESRQ